MILAVFLDSGPLGLATQWRGKSAEADDWKQWITSFDLARIPVYIPEIADYEVRRELLRSNKKAGIARLDVMKAAALYLPITTKAMLLAAELWAEVRQQGNPTADAKALDADVIVAAKVLATGLSRSGIVVATSNASHISRFVTADTWQNIHP